MLIALEDEIIIVALEARGAAREAMWRGPSAQCPVPTACAAPCLLTPMCLQCILFILKDTR